VSPAAIRDAWSRSTSQICAGGVEHLIEAVRRDEGDTVIVGEHDVLTRDDVFAEACARERIGLLQIESQRSGRVGSIAEERECLVPALLGVAALTAQ